jgi:hypothetical protein
VRFRYIDPLGRLVHIYETRAQRHDREHGISSGDYCPLVETFEPDEARAILQRELRDLEARIAAD